MNAETAWLAGIMEGEGCFTTQVRRKKTGDTHHPKIVLKMTDEDIVRHACNIAGVGNVTGPHHPPSSPASNKPTWLWQVSKPTDVKFVLGRIEPWMGSRRQARIAELLDVLS